MSQSYSYHPVYHLVPRQAWMGLEGRPVEAGARAIRPIRLLLMLVVYLAGGLLWLLRALASLVVLCNRSGTPAARADHR